MKNNIVIVLADFYPNPSPNTTCFLPFIKKIEENNNIFIITSDTGKLLNNNFSENVKIIRVKDYKMINHFNWLKIIENTKNKIIRRILTYLSYISKYVCSKIFNDKTEEKAYIGWDKKKVRNVLELVLKENKIDYVISISHPFKTHDIVYEIRNEFEFKWYLLEYDAYGINDFLFDVEGRENRVNKEKNYFECADKILLTPQLYSAYLKNEYKIYRNKFYKLEFCNLYKPDINSNAINLNNTNRRSLFYAGAFNIYIRNPKQVLEFMRNSSVDFEFTIVTKCHLGFVQEEIELLGNRCKILPRQEFSNVYKTECETDINISIGNSIDYQSPGKTLELMSAGRPIVHFAFIETDPVIKYLKNYPNSLIIRLYENNDEQILDFESFIGKNYDNVDLKSLVEKNKEYDPKYIKEEFCRLF